MTKITLEGEYQTRDGRPVRIETVSAPLEQYPVVGYVMNKGQWDLYTWSSDGHHRISHGETRNDLIPVPKRHKRTVWVNLYPDPIDDDAHPSRDLANDCAGPDRIACLKLDLDFVEGEGL